MSFFARVKMYYTKINLVNMNMSFSSFSVYKYSTEPLFWTLCCYFKEIYIYFRDVDRFMSFDKYCLKGLNMNKRGEEKPKHFEQDFCRISVILVSLKKMFKLRLSFAFYVVLFCGFCSHAAFAKKAVLEFSYENQSAMNEQTNDLAVDENNNLEDADDLDSDFPKEKEMKIGSEAVSVDKGESEDFSEEENEDTEEENEQDGDFLEQTALDVNDETETDYEDGDHADVKGT